MDVPWPAGEHRLKVDERLEIWVFFRTLFALLASSADQTLLYRMAQAQSFAVPLANTRVSNWLPPFTERSPLL